MATPAVAIADGTDWKMLERRLCLASDASSCSESTSADCGGSPSETSSAYAECAGLADGMLRMSVFHQEGAGRQCEAARAAGKASPRWSGAPTGAGTGPSAPEIIWCHEHCFKAAEEPTRDAIAKQVNQVGGQLTCFRKAKGFERWLSRSGRQRYVLLTDIREIRHCVQALAAMPDRLPELIIINVEEAKGAQRITSYVRELPAAGFHAPVRVIRALGALAAHLAECFQPPALFPHDHRWACGQCQEAMPAPAEPRTLEATDVAASVAHADCDESARAADAPWSPCVVWTLAPLGLEWAPGVIAPPPVEPRPCATVLRVLAPALPEAADDCAIEHALAAAAPEIYED
mmetsp:Transcript_118442/g.340094  ORF Transcript_118442/g.340094 Transcript_118442/m.340094 type:complete len:347 (-) Transcript_118442:440-1480(-)